LKALFLLFPFAILGLQRLGAPLGWQLGLAGIAAAANLEYRQKKVLALQLAALTVLSVLLLMLRAENLPRIYPFLMSATALMAFWGDGDILVQYAGKFMRITDQRRAFLRKVLPVWTAGLALNTAILLALVFFFPFEYWLWYSGVLSYGLFAALFAITLICRFYYEIRHLVWLAWGFGAFAFACVLSFVLIPLASPLILVGRRDLFGFVTRWGIRQTFRFVLWYLRLFGYLDVQFIEHDAAARRGRLYVCNHTSMFDIISLLAYVPDACTFIKSNFLKVPLIVPAVKAAGYIPIDVTDPEQRTKAFMKALNVLRAGQPLIVFPEGTRSRDGKIGRFQAGVFKLALESGLDLTPVLFTSDQPCFNKVGPFRPVKDIIRFRAHILAPLPTPRAEGTMTVAARAFRDKVELEFTQWLSSDLAGAWNKIDAAATGCLPITT
jgi:1-acyl-sn-glycerol-3-phosphate acyltransferase